MVDKFQRDLLNVAGELLEKIDTATRGESADHVPETSIRGFSGIETIELMRQEPDYQHQAEEFPLTY